MFMISPRSKRIGTLILLGVQVAAILGLLACNVRSKEEQREIDGVKRRVIANAESVDVDDGNGTPLDVAVINNYMELADWLVAHRANLNARDHHGETALHHAVIYDRTPRHEMIHFLLKEGADVNAKRPYDETPLHQAASLGLKEVAAILLEHGANANAPAGRGETPLHMASCPTGYPEIVDLLLQHGANIEARQTNGATPLHQAVLAGNITVVELLLRKGANPAAANQAGQTPLHYAAMGGRAEIAEALLSRNVAVNALDSEGHTALWRALQAPAIAADAKGSWAIDTASVAKVLRQHGGVE